MAPPLVALLVVLGVVVLSPDPLAFQLMTALLILLVVLSVAP